MSTDNHKQQLRKYYRENVTIPSIRKFCELLGKQESYRTQAKRIMDRLVSEDFLGQDDNGHYVPGEQFFSIPLYHGVSASGFAMSGQYMNHLNLLNTIMPDHDNTISITISGDSMIDAGIDDKDIVIVDLDKQLKPGDIVVAEAGGELTIKYYLKDESGNPYLKPANKNYPNIKFQEEDQVNIIGIVIRCIKYFG